MSTSWQNPAWFIAIMVLLSLTISCGSKDPISSLMADLEEAAEAGDVNSIDKRLAPTFSGNDEINREEALVLLRRYFAAYKNIKLDVTNVERSNQGNRLSFQVYFSGQVKAAFNLQNLLPSTSAYHFDLLLVQEGNTLKVRKAYWQQTYNF